MAEQKNTASREDVGKSKIATVAPAAKTSVGSQEGEAGPSDQPKRTLKPIIVKMPGKEEKKKLKIIEAVSKPSNMLFIGALLIAIAYTLYPFRASSMIPGILIGGGVAGLIWVAFRVIYR